MICRNFSHHSYLTVKVKAQRNSGRSLKVRLTKLLIPVSPPKPTRDKKENESTKSHLSGTEKHWEGRGLTTVKKVKYEADCMIKSTHNSYLDNLVSIIDDSDTIENSRPNTKKLFPISKTVDRTVREVHL